jgi:serine/threonine protein kinase
MKQPHWDRIQEIYHAALARPRSERSAFVTKTCAGDLDLEAQVNSLLNAADLSGGILDTPVITLGSLDDLVGTQIDGRYLIERELGHGGMSQVFLARSLKLKDQPVVIKILSEALVHNAHAQQMFERELTALLRIEHGGVVGVKDTGKLWDGRPYIVMQYVDGEPLRSHIQSHGMELERVASIMKQIGAALDHVHDKGILHRDLKPENVMLRRGSDSVVLIDFGIAKVTDPLFAETTATGLLAGTLKYMSPEQLRGETVTAASDVFSMGIVAYEMVTGRWPFNPRSASHLLDVQRKGVVRPIRLRQELPVRADRIITRALKFDPRTRYKRAGEFGDELAEALLNRNTTATTIPIWAKVVGAFVVLALLSYAIVKFVNRNSDPPPTRSFSYWLIVQKLRDGKEYQKSHGEDETFERDDKFQLNVSSSESGYLYIFNERPPGPSGGFSMIYPNNGSATLGANQTFQSDWFTFTGTAGSENFWMVWSVSPVSELESATKEASKHPGRVLTGENLITVREFLRVKHHELDITVYNYKESQKAVARAKSDLLVTLAEFKYR